MMIATTIDCGWIFPAAILFVIIAASWWAGSCTERQFIEARKNGCICERNAWVHHVRSDCPHCSPKRGA